MILCQYAQKDNNCEKIDHSPCGISEGTAPKQLTNHNGRNRRPMQTAILSGASVGAKIYPSATIYMRIIYQ